MRVQLLAAALVIAFALVRTSALAGAAPDADFEAIDRYVARVMDEDRVVGVGLAIVHGDRVVHARGFGVTERGGPAVTADTPFMLGSMSKAITALAVMKLVEAGKLKLEAPVTDYLPWFRVTPPIADGVPLSLSELLNHTSGIPRSADPPGGPVTTLERRVRDMVGVRLDAPVAKRYGYASANYQILGLLVETASGLPFGTYVEREIFAPLGMTKSFVSWEAARAGGAAAGHRYWFGRPVRADLPFESDRLPTASILASASDLARFEMMHLGGGKLGDRAVVAPATVAELVRPTARAGDFSYAMGWRVGAIAGARAIHHGGVLPHYRGKMVMLPDEHWGIVVLTNASSELGTPTSHRLADDIAAMLVGHPARVSATPLGRIYVVADLVAALVVLLTVKEIAGLRRWRASLGRIAHDPSVRLKAPLSVALSIGVALGLLCGPWAFGLPWAEAIRVLPDFACLLLVTQSVALAMALAKLSWLIRARRASRPGGILNVFARR